MNENHVRSRWRRYANIFTMVLVDAKSCELELAD